MPDVLDALAKLCCCCACRALHAAPATSAWATASSAAVRSASAWPWASWARATRAASAAASASTVIRWSCSSAALTCSSMALTCSSSEACSEAGAGAAPATTRTARRGARERPRGDAAQRTTVFRRCRVAKATVLPSSRPPTELADGFGPDGALPACASPTQAGLTPEVRWVPGPPRPREGRRRFGGGRAEALGSRGAEPGRAVGKPTRARARGSRSGNAPGAPLALLGRTRHLVSVLDRGAVTTGVGATGGTTCTDAVLYAFPGRSPLTRGECCDLAHDGTLSGDCGRQHGVVHRGLDVAPGSCSTRPAGDRGRAQG